MAGGNGCLGRFIHDSSAQVSRDHIPQCHLGDRFGQVLVTACILPLLAVFVRIVSGHGYNRTFPTMLRSPRAASRRFIFGIWMSNRIKL